MENGTGKVCRRCGTLNDERSLMCIRCGEMLEVAEDNKYAIVKDRLITGKMICFLFVILFTAYLFGMVFYAGPWIESKVLLLENLSVFNYYNNPTLTYVVLETIYTFTIFLVNSIAITIILYTIVNTKLLKQNSVKATYLFMWIYMFISIAVMTILKHNFDYVVILEHLASIILILPYVKKKILKMSI